MSEVRKALQHAVSILEQIDFSAEPNVKYDDVQFPRLEAASRMSVEFSKIERVISEPSSEGDTFIVRGLQFRAYERGETVQPSVFICECDTEEMAEAIAKLIPKEVVR